MASITVSKSRVALPWYGCVILVVEIGAYSTSDTLVLSSVDGGQGISFVYGVLAFKATGLPASVTTGPTVSSNGTTVTMGTDTSITTLIVFGR